MSKNRTHPTPIADLRARWERARTEGRFQQALEVGKLVYAAETTPDNLERLKETYVGRATQLRTQGQPRDAATVLEVAARYDDRNPTWLGRLAREMAACGDTVRTQTLLERVRQLGGATPTDGLQTEVRGRLADGAFLDPKRGRDTLPADLRGEYDLIVIAFGRLHAGDDAKVLPTVQSIGIRSPFAEWKLLLRGLVAYYARDDARAIENWSRLDPARLPARLAAAYRAAIDPAYQQAQLPQTQQALRDELTRLQGTSPEAVLTRLQQAMHHGGRGRRSLAEPLRIVEPLMRDLRVRSPRLAQRLANLLYWAILDTSPDDINRYRRVLGNPADDPTFDRLMAIGFERAGDLTTAHEHWNAFQDAITRHPHAWPGDTATLARALVWVHMGELAESVPTREQRQNMPRFLRELEELPQPLSPPARVCFQEALKLAPDLLEAHEGHFRLLAHEGKFTPAVKAGERLLELFPDHVETLRELAELCYQRKKFAAGLTYLERAIRLHPLDRALRSRLKLFQLSEARQRTEAGQFDQATALYRAALADAPPAEQWSIQCRWAASEIKAGNRPHADELLEKAGATAAGSLPVVYCMLVECNRLALPGTLKTQYTRQFNQAIGGTPTMAVALPLLEYAAGLNQGKVDYHGRQTHFKKILAYATKLDASTLDEPTLLRYLVCLVGMEASTRVLPRLFRQAGDRFPTNPRFPYMHAVYLMGDNPEDAGPLWQIDQMLRDAEQLARRRPREEPGLPEMLEDISRRRRLVQAANPFLGGLDRLFGFPGTFDFEDDLP
ncbi:MAG: hypothetical protein U0736_07290 [Gemmataceae bacterium]